MTDVAASDSNQVRLILHGERPTYSIGEPIRPQLQIVNQTAQKIEWPGFVFDWQKLAFTDPNFVHLIDPAGTELLLPYRRDREYFSSIAPISVEPGKEEWLYLPIYAHLHLREPGAYRFSLELVDNLGQMHHSNEINFQLVDVPSSVPPTSVELRLESKKSSFATPESIEVEAIFSNHSDQPLIFLKPQQDSFYGWTNPVYQFTVLDQAGRSLALARRSGSMAEPHYDRTTQFTVAPGASTRQPLQLPPFPDMQHPGEYQVRLTYIVRREAIGKAGIVLANQMDWEEGIFMGRLESNPITLTIK